MTTTDQPEPTYATVGVETGRTEEGTYFLGFTCGDAAWALGRMDAQLYALGVLQLVQRAEYDSAVMRLFVNKLGMDLNTAGMFVMKNLRKNRAEVKQHDAGRLGFVIGVSHRGLKPFLTVTCDGQTIGQWELPDAREHALFVIEACEAVDLDTELTRVLTEDIDLDAGRAAVVVRDLRQFRWKPGDDETEVIAASELVEGRPGAVPPA